MDKDRRRRGRRKKRAKQWPVRPKRCGPYADTACRSSPLLASFSISLVAGGRSISLARMRDKGAGPVVAQPRAQAGWVEPQDGLSAATPIASDSGLRRRLTHAP